MDARPGKVFCTGAGSNMERPIGQNRPLLERQRQIETHQSRLIARLL